MYLSPLLQGGKRTGLINQIFIWSVLCDPMWSTGTRLFCTPRFYSSGSVNQQVCFTAAEVATFYRVDPDCLVQTLDDGPTGRLPEYSAFEIY